MLVDFWLLKLFGASAFTLRLPSLLSAVWLLICAPTFLGFRGLGNMWKLALILALLAQTSLMNFAAAREQRATGPRVLAFIRDVKVSGAQDTEYQVYLDTPETNPQDGASDPSYVGSFGVFVHGEHGGHGDEETDTNADPSFVLDLTGAIQRVYGSGLASPGAFKLRFVPVGTKPNAKPGTIRPGQVEIVFLNA